MLSPNLLCKADCLEFLERVESQTACLVYLDPPWFTAGVEWAHHIQDEGRNSGDKRGLTAGDDSFGRYLDWLSNVIQQAKRIASTKGTVVRKVESFHYRTDGVPLPKTTYSYGEGGLLAREDYFSAVSGRPYLETVYTYDSRGRVKEEVGRDLEDGTVLSRRVYNHDEKRDYTEITKYDLNNAPREKVGIVWDGEGRASEFVNFSPWCDGCGVKLTYDEKGRVSETTMSRPGVPGAEKERYAYEDDARGNWVKKTHHRRVTEGDKSSDKLMDVTYRAITYY